MNTLTPALHTATGPAMNHNAVVHAIGATFAGVGAGKPRGGLDFVQFRVTIPGADQRHTAAIKTTGENAFTVEIGQVDKTTSIPVYRPIAQRQDVTLDDIADALCDAWAEVTQGPVSVDLDAALAALLPPTPDSDAS